MSDFFISLLYHNVCPATWRTRPDGPLCDLVASITNCFVDEPVFADQIRALTRTAPCLRPDDMRRFYAGAGLPASPRGVAPVQITFDDGWRGSVDYGGPILAELNWQALLFVTTSLIGKPLLLSRSELHRLSPETFLVGSHCRTHRHLYELPTTEIRDELQASKAELESIVGYEVDCVSIPHGAVDERVRTIASDVGYRYVFSSAVHRNTRQHGPLSIGRVTIRQTAAAIERYASGDLGVEQIRSGVRQIPRQILGRRAYRRMRIWLRQDSASSLELNDFVDRP
jgi:peptidoglycan/xylan/chitin deacetylase (PgdA/CDA1 family)